MTWNDKQPILARLGITGFISEAHFDEWLTWECEHEQEKQIRKAFKQWEYQLNYTPLPSRLILSKQTALT